MTKRIDVGNLCVGGIFHTSDDFDFAVRRYNQDNNKLLKLAKRNKTRIHHICLLQARENDRVSKLKKGKKRKLREKPTALCEGS